MPSHKKWTAEEDEIILAYPSYDEYVKRATELSMEVRREAAVRSRRHYIRSKERKESRIEWSADFFKDTPRDSVDTIDEWYQSIKQLTAIKLRRVERQESFDVDLETDNYTAIVFVGDMHIGGPIEYGLLERDLKLIQETDGCYAIGMGDYAEMFESATKLQKAMAGTVVPSSEEQLELVTHIMGFTDKWLLLLLGNHDGWAGQSGIRKLANSIGAHYASEAGCSVRVTVGGQRYVLYTKHQWKGHSNVNTSNESRRFWQEFKDFENADVTVLAHYHQPDMHYKEIKGQTVIHLRGGTYKLHDEYSFKGGFDPAYGPAMIILSPEGKEVIAFHGPQWVRGIQFLNHLREEYQKNGTAKPG